MERALFDVFTLLMKRKVQFVGLSMISVLGCTNNIRDNALCEDYGRRGDKSAQMVQESSPTTYVELDPDICI